MQDTAQVFTHIPVLFHETIEALSIRPDGIYVDATFGRGGHSRGILQKLGPQGRLYALDRDLTAVAAGRELEAQDARFKIVHAPFSHLLQVCEELGIAGKVDGLLMDIGISSPQIDDPSRGFSFDKDGPLDMRMDTSCGHDAAWFVNTLDADELTRIFRDYGEERFARNVAKAIVREREKTPFTTTKQLAALMATSIPGAPGKKHKATRCFQALRIAVNGELDELQAALAQSLEVLDNGARLCVITFHSLEDRIVKQFMRTQSELPDLPRGLPVTDAELMERYADKVTLKLAGKAQKAGAQELEHNVRARSATLRTAIRLRAQQ